MNAFLVLLIMLVTTPVWAAPGDTSICLLKNNKKAALTIVMDDGVFEAVQYFVGLFRRDGLKATAAPVTSQVGPDDDPRSYYSGHWRDWVAWYQEGILDLANHTQNHCHLSSTDPTYLCKGAPLSLENEINGAKSIIDQHLPGYQNLTLVYPYNEFNEEVKAKVRERHYAARSGPPFRNGYNSLNPTEEEFFTLFSLGAVSGVTSTMMNGWVDEALAQGKWLVEMWHTCQGFPGYDPPLCEDLDQHTAYLKNRLNELWVGSFQEVTQYIRERMTSQVAVVSRGPETLILNLTYSLPADLFRYPLTLKTEIPLEWIKNQSTTIQVIQGRQVRAVGPVQEGGKTFIYFEAIPNGDEIRISTWKSYLPYILKDLAG